MSATEKDVLAMNPQLLREPSWLLHKNKKPYYANGKPRSGTLDSPEDLAKLVTYPEAVAALAKGKFSGLGFAIHPGYNFVDLDKVRDEVSGLATKGWVADVVNAAIELGAFVEVSRSGTGFHIIGLGDVVTHKGANIEVYSKGRYMAVGCEIIATGDDPLPDLGPILAMLNPRMAPSTPKPDKPGLRLVAGRTALLWPDEKRKLPELLAKLDPDMTYPEWVRVGMAIHNASGGAEDGLLAWDTWSMAGDKHREGYCAKLWAGFKPDGGVTMGTLVHMAQQSTEPVSSPVIAPPSTRRKEFTDDELMDVEHPPIPWMVDELICPGLTLLAAPPKMGKSYFVLQMALCVGSGKPFLGRQTRQVPVSYFDLEEWEEMLQARRKHIGAANGISRSKVRYAMELTGDTVGVMEDVQRHIDEGSKLIIIDLLARVRNELNEDSKKNVYARDYEVLRKFADFVLQRNQDVAIVMVHHTNKGTNHEGWQSKISGSQGLAGASHTNMLLDNIDLRGLDDEARKNALRYRRFHVAGKAVEPDEIMLEMMPNGGGWQISGKTAEEVKTTGKHAHILQILREADGAWVTAKDIHEQVDGTLDSVKKMLMRMAKKGEIESGGSGGPGYRAFQ